MTDQFLAYRLPRSKMQQSAPGLHSDISNLKQLAHREAKIHPVYIVSKLKTLEMLNSQLLPSVISQSGLKTRYSISCLR